MRDIHMTYVTSLRDSTRRASRSAILRLGALRCCRLPSRQPRHVWNHGRGRVLSTKFLHSRVLAAPSAMTSKGIHLDQKLWSSWQPSASTDLQLAYYVALVSGMDPLEVLYIRLTELLAPDYATFSSISFVPTLFRVP